MPPALAVENLTRRYAGLFGLGGQVAVDDLSFEVPAGAGLAFLGPNGAGKTTTLYLILGLLRPTTGRVAIFGLPAGDPASRRRVGFLAESVSMHPYYCPQDALRFYARLYGMGPVEIEDRVAKAMEITGLGALARKSIRTLSRGQVQRVGLAQALLAEPDLILLDEPTANLDPLGRKELKDVLLAMRARGTTLVISSHILSEVEAICDHLVMIDRGRLVHAGPLAGMLGARRLRATGLPAEAIAGLEQHGTVTRTPDGAVEVAVQDREAQYAAITLIHQAGGDLVGVQSGRTLEDLYVELAQGGKRA